MKSKEMIFKLIKNVVTNLALTGAITAVVVLALSQYFGVQLQISNTTLVLAIIGTTLAFVGNNFVSDGLGRFGAYNTPQYVWGNRMQSVGFALTIAALLIR